MRMNTFDKHLGIQIVRTGKGFSEYKLKVKQAHLNFGGIVHGGVITSLCDIALAGAIKSSLKKDEWCVTAQLNVDFLHPVYPGETLYGFGKLVKKGNTLAFVEGGIRTQSRKQIANAQGIWVVKTKPNKKIKIAKILS